MDRRQLLKRVATAWEAFNESYAGLSDAQLMEAGVTGAWSVRDILAHVTTWEEEALKHLPLILKGGTPPRYRVVADPGPAGRLRGRPGARLRVLPGSLDAGAGR